MTRAPRPRVIDVRRIRPHQASIGDSATVQLAPGLIAFLENLPDAAFHSRYNIPASMGASAAAAILSPLDQPGSYWSGRDLEVEWSAPAGIHDTVLVDAILAELSDRLSRFAIRGVTSTGIPLYTGTLRMMAIRDGVPAGFRSQAEYEQLRAKFKSVPQLTSLPLGQSAPITISSTLPVTAHLPPGAGLSLDSPATQHPDENGQVTFHIRADRPHLVNLGKPWELHLLTDSSQQTISIEVPDPNPGRIFYLLTEDCETFDGGPLTGDYPARGMGIYGNQNNFMDPEDYRVQMILKPDRLNRIADRHGARWTHFYAATQRFGAAWAATQSSTGEWNRIVEEMDRSVREGSLRHEYCPHIHFDYEPDSQCPPQPRLLYDRATDGIIPNDYYHPETNPTHRYHDWDGAARDNILYLKTPGSWATGDSKIGSLRKTHLHLARLQAGRRAPAVARTGSFDFGKTAEDQTVSTYAYLANGLRGNSDAYRPGADPVPGGQMFWCTQEDRQVPVNSLDQVRLVQFAITMDTFFQSAADMNQWFARHWESVQGPGVHALLSMTHAMFCAGTPDPFRSLEGGAFDQLDRHLAWVREHYPQVEFATATEALLEYLDYYTPALDTYTEAPLIGGNPAEGYYEFHVRLLGTGIRVDEQHPATVRIAAPPCFSPADLATLRVWQDWKTIAQEEAFDERCQPAVTVTLTNRAPLRLEVILRPEAVAATRACFPDLAFHEPPEPPKPDLFRVRPPTVEGSRLRFYSDVVKLLMNPVAGHHEPLGRRVHPLGGLTLGIALTTALRTAGEAVPQRIKLRWLRETDLNSTFVAETSGTLIYIRDDRATLVAQAEVTLVGQPLPPAHSTSDLAVWRRDFQSTLATYRSQRAWRVMLAVRKIYDIAARGTWGQRLSLIWWIPSALLGKASGLDDYELRFPDFPHK